jgi:hypothetical protein
LTVQVAARQDHETMRKLSSLVLASALLCSTAACAEQKGKPKDKKADDAKKGAKKG